MDYWASNASTSTWIRLESITDSLSTETSEESRENNSQENADSNISLLYLYGTASLILLCIISVGVNIKILISVYWIRRPLSPTLYISLSLAGADAFSSTALGIGLFMNSFLPHGLRLRLIGIDCFLLELEAIRLGAVIITVLHLMALAVNHYLGILKPLRYISIMTHKHITFAIILLWILPLFFFTTYFSLVENEGFQSDDCETKTFLYGRKFRLLFSSLFFGPFLLMVCIYVHIFYVVKRHQALRSQVSRAVSILCERNTEDSQNASRQIARNVKAVYTTLYILGSFAVGWMPGTIIYMLVCEDCLLEFDWASRKVRFFVYHTINCLIILKTLVNPFIYAARMHEIKIATRRMHASFYECIGFENFEIDPKVVRRNRSKDLRNNRSSSRTAISRFTRNASTKNPRNGSSITCTGYGRQGQGSTSV